MPHAAVRAALRRNVRTPSSRECWGTRHIRDWVDNQGTSHLKPKSRVCNRPQLRRYRLREVAPHLQKGCRMKCCTLSRDRTQRLE